jgi:hypothetical protein
MKDMRAVRANEKLKRASTVLGTIGAALFVAGFTRWYISGLDLTAPTWIFIAAIVIWVSLQINELLDSEDER